MYKKINVLITGALFLAGFAVGQTISGRVVEYDAGSKKEVPIPGANIHLAGTNEAAASDADGNFTIPAATGDKLVISFVGYKTDTVSIGTSSVVKITLQRAIQLNEVNVTGKRDALLLSKINPINTERITEKELLKAACCNLSESFETNPTVNVAYTDAVTGAKEIQMLGLAGIYSQLMTENIPNMRGIAGIYGLTFIPGPWMESIQVTKGTGSVLNGYESTSGQLNVEFKKPQEKETPRFYLNLYGETNTRAELNTHYKLKLNDAWSTILMVHGNYMDKTIDRNSDGFHDMPHSKQINLYNRWQYHSKKNLEAQIGLKFLADKKHGGQVHTEDDDEVDHHKTYVVDVLNKRAEVFGKLGILFPENPVKSIGNILTVQYHDLGSTVGLKHYDATEQTLYYQSIFQNIIKTTEHEYKVGVSFQYDRLNENFNEIQSIRTRYVPGAFMEYTYSAQDRFKAVVGLREDYNSKYGFIFTPRLHVKYDFNELFLVRASAGKSFRESYVVADNFSVLASSKKLLFNEVVKPEEAWNYGLNFTKGFIVKEKEATINVDFYRTDFINQLVVDRYTDSSSVSFYNLDGKSFSNSFQVSVSYEVIKNLEVRLAYKMDDVKSTYAGKLERKPLIPKQVGMLNLAYATDNEHWKFNYTINWVGVQRLTNTTTDPVFGRSKDYSDDFVLMNFQTTKVFRHFEVYAGVENLLDYRQDNPIIASSAPFSDAFDATNIWAPVDGARIYAGLRYQIK